LCEVILGYEEGWYFGFVKIDARTEPQYNVRCIPVFGRDDKFKEVRFLSDELMSMGLYNELLEMLINITRKLENIDRKLDEVLKKLESKSVEHGDNK